VISPGERQFLREKRLDQGDRKGVTVLESRARWKRGRGGRRGKKKGGKKKGGKEKGGKRRRREGKEEGEKAERGTR